MKRLLRFVPLLILLIAAGVVYGTGVWHQLTWQSLAVHHEALQAAVASHRLLAPALFVLIYAAAVSLSLPVGLWLSLGGGVLFGGWFGGVLTVIGASIGALVIFMVARSALAPFFQSKFGGKINKLAPGMQAGLERDGFSYLLAVRLMPVVPFWLANLAPALLGMRLFPYAAATIIGLIPASLVLNAVGAGLASTLVPGQTPDAMVLFHPIILFPCIGFTALALAPVIWRRVKSPRGPVSDPVVNVRH